jgi:ribosome recycling factor
METEQVKEIFDKLNVRCQKALDFLKNELAAIRAGRANPQLFDKLLVDYYGTPTPLNQMANISAPEPRAVVISVWDAGAVKLVEKAILASDLGLTPTNDGKSLRVNFPVLTEERRKDLVKQIKKMAEDSRVVVRNDRRDCIEALKKLKNDKLISEDELSAKEKEADKAIAKHLETLEKIYKDKETEILTV